MKISRQHLLSHPQEIADSGEGIYDRKYRESYEGSIWGAFVAIDVRTEEAYVGSTSSEALNKAREVAPKGVFHLLRVGSPGAFHVSRANASPSEMQHRR